MKLKISLFFLIFSVCLLSSNEKVDFSIFNANRGSIYSTGIGFGTGFFIDANSNNLMMKPYYVFSFENFDFLFASLVSLTEDLNSGNLNYLNSYLGFGVNWHIIDFAYLLKYFSSTVGIGGKVYLSVNFIGDIRFYNKIPYIIDPYFFIEFSTKRSIESLNLYFRFEFLFLDTSNISFDLGLKYVFKPEVITLEE